MNALEQLDKLIGALDETAPSASAPKADGDGIDAILAAPPRVTETRSLREDPVMRRFRQEVSDGLIRVDTVGRVLNLLSQVVAAALAGGA